MPTYVYRCKSCDHQIEIVQKMSDAPLTECPKCKGELRKVLFPVGIAFKGSGFHVNDYPSSSSCTAAPAPTTSSANADTAKTPAAASK